MRMPSAATEEQSQADVQAADPNLHLAEDVGAQTEPFPEEPTDVLEGDTGEDFQGDNSEEEEEFTQFEDLNTRSRGRVSMSPNDIPQEMVQPVRIDRDAAEQEAYDTELIPIIPRRTQMRVSINGRWFNFTKGIEQFVPRYVADHIRERGYL
jgi:hypothetical protein